MKIEDYENVLRPISLGFHSLVRFYEYLANITYTLVSFLFYYIGLRKSPSQGMQPKEGYHPGVFVSGGTSGIGRHSALKLANAGFTVYASYRDYNQAKKLISDFEKQFDGVIEKKGRIIPIELDFDKEGSISRCYKEISKDLSERGIPLKAVVNNAGFCTMSAFELTSKRDIDYQFRMVHDTYIEVIKTFLPLLKESKGRIINVNSVGSYTITPGFGAYCAAKAAMKMVTLSLRMELSRYDVTVSSIEPGFTSAKSIYSNILDGFEKYYEDESNTVTGVTSQGETTHSDQSGTYSGQTSDYLKSTARDYKVLIDDWFLLIRLFRIVGQPTANVASNVLHAVSSSYSNPVYISGFDARLYDLAERFVPEDFIEWTLGKFMFPFIYNEKEKYSREQLRDTAKLLIKQKNKRDEPLQDPKNKQSLDSFYHPPSLNRVRNDVASPLTGKMKTDSTSSPVISSSSILKEVKRNKKINSSANKTSSHDIFI